MEFNSRNSLSSMEVVVEATERKEQTYKTSGHSDLVEQNQEPISPRQK